MRQDVKRRFQKGFPQQPAAASNQPERQKQWKNEEG
jgi:hypothetical protein